MALEIVIDCLAHEHAVRIDRRAVEASRLTRPVVQRP